MKENIMSFNSYFRTLTCTLFLIAGLMGIAIPASHAATGAFTFSAATYSASEGAGKVSITINRVGGSSGAATVSWRTLSSTATYNKDYKSFGWTALSFADGQTQKVMTVALLEDTLVEPDETFKVSLAYPSTGTTLGTITSAVVTIKDNDTVLADTTAPVVSLSSPVSGTTYTSAQTVTIAASATDNIGVSKVELYNGATLLVTDSVAPYSFAWAITSSNNGSYSFTAKAYDAAGNSKVSAIAAVTVNIPVPDLTAPTVSLSSPVHGATYASAQTVTIAASATDNIGVSKVEFYDGATLKGTDSSAPYSFAWAITSSDNGSHSFTAKAYDAAGNSKVSAVAAVTVNIPVPDLTAPTVAISTPANNTTYTSAQTVAVAISAADNIGVSKVELYDGTTLKGTDSSAPYSISWAISESSNGVHSLTAKAYDAAGNSKVSAVVLVNVNIVPPVATVFYGYDKSVGANDSPYAAPYGGIARYVDPVKGVNTGMGSISSPWKNMQYALTSASAGDTIYLRGGVHNYGVTVNNNVAATQLKPIEVRSYPGEWAIIDGTNIANGNLVRLLNEAWIIFRNFEIRNSDITKAASGIYAENLTDCQFHNLYIHHNNGGAFSGKLLYRLKFYNCTATNNANIQSNGNTGDGFSVTSGGKNEYYRCVAIANSDDGYDFWASTENYLEDCIAASNGALTEGNGNGFKLGKPDASPVPESRGGFHTLVRCISLNNRRTGISENGTINGSTLSGCISYKNAAQNWSIGNAAHKVTNGVSFDGGSDTIGTKPTVVASKGQGFGGTVYVSDFESVDMANMNSRTYGSRFFVAVRPLF